ncbi:hypothetical protein [Streptomyces sp. NPDC051219]|uniref:hypothetical protein n=1 Tax=Streptomyces sp. NPDC051219 TaxID=3155283 RepID=UPI003425B352
MSINQQPSASGSERRLPSVGNIEIDPPAETGEVRNLPRGACAATFAHAPHAARNARTLRPCHLKRGHSGKHENDSGVSWEDRTTSGARRTIRTERSKSVPTPTSSSLQARMKRAEKAMNAPASATRSTSSAYTRRTVDGPVQQAKRAVDLATPPQWGWWPSQLRVVLENLERDGSKLLQYAVDHDQTPSSNRRETEQLRSQLHEARGVLMPGVEVKVRQEFVDSLRKAIRAVAKPLEEQQRDQQQWTERLAAGRRALDNPAPPAPAHPWFAGSSVA